MYTITFLTSVGVVLIVNDVVEPSPVKISFDIVPATASVLSAVYVEPSSETSYFPVVVLNLITPS